MIFLVFVGDSALSGYDDSLPIELLYSEFFNVSSQSVINYHKSDHRFLVVFSITVDLKTVHPLTTLEM